MFSDGYAISFGGGEIPVAAGLEPYMLPGVSVPLRKVPIIDDCLKYSSFLLII